MAEILAVESVNPSGNGTATEEMERGSLERIGVPHVPSNEVIQDAEAAKPRSTTRMSAILVALYLSLFTAALDQTIVATAIPTIASQLHESSGFAWIGGAYALAAAAAAPIWAKLSDIWGRKAIVLLAVVWFFASSIVCATAKTMNALIIGRAFQGTAGTGILQMVNIVLSDILSMRRRAFFFGLFETMWLVAAGLGPVLGGAFSEFLSWRWMFWINLPMSAITFVLLFLFLDVHNPRTKALDGIKAIDWFGSISVVGFALMLLLGLNFGGELFPWNSAKVICLIVAGALMSVVFVFGEKKLTKNPLVPLSIFSNRANISTLLVGFSHSITYIGPEYYLPLYFQAVHGASPLHSGALILPYSVTEAVVSIIGGLVIHRTGRYLEMIYIGFITLTLGTGLMILLNAHTKLGLVLFYEIIAGASGLVFVAPLIAIQVMVRQDEVATATGTLGFVRNVGTSLGLVIGGVIFQNGMDSRSSVLTAAGLPSNMTDKFAGSQAEANVMEIGRINDIGQRLVVKEAYAWSLQHLWIFYCCMAAFGLLSSVFMVKAKLSDVHVETRTGLEEKDNNQAQGAAVEMT